MNSVEESNSNETPVNLGAASSGDAAAKDLNPAETSYDFEPSKSAKPSNPDTSSKQEASQAQSKQMDLKSSAFAANPATSNSEVGEGEILWDKITAWFRTNQMSNRFNRLIPSLLLIIALVAFFIVLNTYGSILSAIAKIPLAPKLFELTGIIWLIQFSITNLARTEDRREVLSSLSRRWNDFTGNPEIEP